MKLYVGVTDYNWFKFHSSKERVEEVNFWKPSSQGNFRVLQWKEPFLFKIQGQRFIGGGGFFTKFIPLPLTLAWESFLEANGTKTIDQFRSMIAGKRRETVTPNYDPVIGCTLLQEPFFFEKDDWIDLPQDFRHGIQMGKGYDLETGTGLSLWKQVTERLERAKAKILGPATIAAQTSSRFGKPILVTPRLGQGSFRILVTDAYGNRCAMTSERTLPALEAGHIRPYSEDGEHELSNGLPLRRDLHKLFDLGYISVDPMEKKIIVSEKIREEFQNGREYYTLHGRVLASPINALALPSIENLRYHAEHKFRG